MSVNMFSLLVFLLTAVGSIRARILDDVLLTVSQQQFSTVLFRTIAANTNYTKDVFFSPYSIYSAMSTVYIASAGNSEKSLKKLLRLSETLPDKSYISKVFFHEATKNCTKQYTLASVNRIYYTPDIKVKKDKLPPFGDTVAVFKTETDREGEINNWVSNYTKGMINNLFKKGTIKSGSTIVSVNAAYFKGNWVVPLTDGTRKSPFTLSDGSVTETLFMSVQGGLFLTMTDQKLKAQVISLPYKGDDVSMIIILPTTKPQKNAAPPIADVVKNLASTNFQSILAAFHLRKECTTDLLIPKFESEGKYELKPIFETLGYKELFTQDMDLSNLFESGASLNFDRIVHQAKVNVYENGTEAAAATAVVTNSLPKCTFHADHPFIYIIYDDAHSFIQYMGILNTPTH